jgi:hypothetical protein
MYSRLSSFAGALISAGLVAVSQFAYADDKGQVTHLSGVLSAKKPDGTIRILAERSEVSTGDVLTSEKNTYANIRFSDGTQMTMKPASSVKVEKFAYQVDKPQEDSFAVSLITGGLRLVTGLVGARNRAKFSVTTQTATIGIRGTTFNIDDCVDVSGEGCGGHEAGIYVGVTNGQVAITNNEGSLVIRAGQFSRVSTGAAPRPVSNPGFLFTPPPSFLRSGVSTGPRPTECVVRR